MNFIPLVMTLLHPQCTSCMRKKCYCRYEKNTFCNHCTWPFCVKMLDRVKKFIETLLCIQLYFVESQQHKKYNKKLNYRRETARQLHMTTWAGQLTFWWSHVAVECTEHGRIAEFVLLLTFKRSDSKNAGRKRILAWNNQSRSFKVIYFAVICRGSISSYYIACRISDVFEDIAS